MRYSSWWFSPSFDFFVPHLPFSCSWFWDWNGIECAFSWRFKYIPFIWIFPLQIVGQTLKFLITFYSLPQKSCQWSWLRLNKETKIWHQFWTIWSYGLILCTASSITIASECLTICNMFIMATFPTCKMGIIVLLFRKGVEALNNFAKVTQEVYIRKVTWPWVFQVL